MNVTVVITLDQLFYLQKDLINLVLEEKFLEFMWEINGERHYAHTENFHSNDDSVKYNESLNFFVI